MATLTFKGKEYSVDDEGFLVNPEEWDEGFAEGAAPQVKIAEGLNDLHWKIIRFIRNLYDERDRCPTLHETCRNNGLLMSDLERLFPTGYCRGACKLAGVTCCEAYITHLSRLATRDISPPSSKTYEVDARGFLTKPEQWDEQFAVFKAHEMNMPIPLTKAHWQIIRYLRDYYKQKQMVPMVYETCRDNEIELAELERLFPNGYHRGAVKIAGLWVR